MLAQVRGPTVDTGLVTEDAFCVGPKNPHQTRDSGNLIGFLVSDG